MSEFGIVTAFDSSVIAFMKKVYLPAARLALFVVFGWFGVLKIFGLSPATPLVRALFDQTLPFLPFNEFMMAFGIFELAIGIAFLIKGFERLAIALLLPHMVMTAMPLVLLPGMVWTSWFVPTLEGQYIIKNLVLVAAAIGIAAQLVPLRKKKAKNSKEEK